jgi:hypothetical protein
MNCFTSVFVVLECYKRNAVKLTSMPSYQGEHYIKVTSAPIVNSAKYQSPDKLLFLRTHTRNQASCSSDDDLNLHSGILPVECLLDYVSTQIAGFSELSSQAPLWKS